MSSDTFSEKVFCVCVLCFMFCVLCLCSVFCVLDGFQFVPGGASWCHLTLSLKRAPAAGAGV